MDDNNVGCGEYNFGSLNHLGMCERAHIVVAVCVVKLTCVKTRVSHRYSTGRQRRTAGSRRPERYKYRVSSVWSTKNSDKIEAI